MSDIKLPFQEIEKMISNWAETPENGYHGSSYGGNSVVKKYFSTPQSELASSEVIAKLKKDISYFKFRSISITCKSTANSLTLTIDNESIDIFV